VVTFEKIYEYLGEVDIVLSSTGSPDFILSYDKTKEVIHKRGSKPLFIIDIAVPRDVDPKVNTLPNLFLYDIDSLNLVVDKNRKKRMEEIPKAQRIIQEETKNFMDWYESLQYKPLIQSLCLMFEDIRKEEVEKNLHRFEEKDREKIELLSKSLIKKLLHTPLSKIKNIQNETDEWFRKLDTLRELFELDKVNGKEH
jgi:glutamyl-tRNA reductase